KALEERARREEERKKQPYEAAEPIPLISESVVDVGTGDALRSVKPGHWTSIVQSVVSKFDDLDGTSTLSVVPNESSVVPPVPYTAQALVSRRPMLVAKGRSKRIETELLIPESVERPYVASRLEFRNSHALVIPEQRSSMHVMPHYRYFFVVLAANPAEYGFLPLLNSVRPRWESDDGSDMLHYRVVLPDVARPPPVPSRVLDWTSVAYVLWDGEDAARLDPNQQQALVDWIHWGGRLIISGPDSLDSLRASFLADYLPASSDSRRQFTAEQLQPLQQRWGTLADGRQLDSLKALKPWDGLALQPRDANVDAPMAGVETLGFERRVGLGSVAVTAFRLKEKELVNWPAFDSFFNSAVLGRPPRLYYEVVGDAMAGLRTGWDGYEGRFDDAYFTTPLRWLSRDAGTKAGSTLPPLPPGVAPLGPGYPQFEEEPRLVAARAGGLGSWNDFSPAADAAREALSEAAGVRVPGGGFVLLSLAVYLVALAPLNWLVFHALRRVEWAWIAAPLISLGATGAVVHLAQLDIGFASARTEIALLELQGSHARGHLTRFHALYSSLGKTYDLKFDDDSAVAAPFPRDRNFELGRYDNPEITAFEKYDEVHLRDLSVASSSTLMIHSEEMAQLTGALRLTLSSGGAEQIDNHTGLDLRNVVVLRRKRRGEGFRHEACWVGDLRSGEIKPLPMRDFNYDPKAIPFEVEQKKADGLQNVPPLAVDAVLKIAYAFPEVRDPIHGMREETRLVARVDGTLPGAVIEPGVSQRAGAAVVVAHLAYGPGRKAAADLNRPPKSGTDEVLPLKLESQ
ncbi:MAG: hypothetical protein KDA61_02575, partial [Planctomycetales bacterium]|nr:hypothetical protein [Planctomycetales bacterium]